MSTARICDCGRVVVPPFTLAKYADGVDHRPDPGDCTPTDLIVIDAPTLAEGLDKLRVAVAEALAATA